MSWMSSDYNIVQNSAKLNKVFTDDNIPLKTYISVFFRLISGTTTETSLVSGVFVTRQLLSSSTRKVPEWLL